ncbi:FCS-Like Zinc finger 17 [Ricinus communis]|uniref:FLZ-type domain-containing protein n=1 Tax=Ricinus communis TaxID=3988 RepID=B9T6Y5_RICCO|nr:FCS-Like Zinc finger 17 [Ricinus communis]EEF28375.1 conserved hypothetical protein [Ricinus communis]|eukprot:XP_002534004.1 uncharacterized protein LOC8258900 [Ricinus communis]
MLRGYSSRESSEKGLMVLVGLQTLVHVSEGKSKSNVVTKSAMRKAPHHRHRRPHHQSTESCYLKTCHLCNKNLSLDKDIYMYRGDQGFCSIECRNRQIVLDEMRELEASTVQMRKSYNRHCSSAGRHETRLILEEIRRRHKPVIDDHQKKHWAIV